MLMDIAVGLYTGRACPGPGLTLGLLLGPWTAGSRMAAGRDRSDAWLRLMLAAACLQLASAAGMVLAEIRRPAAPPESRRAAARPDSPPGSPSKHSEARPRRPAPGNAEGESLVSGAAQVDSAGAGLACIAAAACGLVIAAVSTAATPALEQGAANVEPPTGLLGLAAAALATGLLHATQGRLLPRTFTLGEAVLVTQVGLPAVVVGKGGGLLVGEQTAGWQTGVH